ncbi:MAG TPA: hypothetical protein VMB18_06995 [Terriglobales bacterium]|nr:hypothetical protein [Terriglobales bacterium]
MKTAGFRTLFVVLLVTASVSWCLAQDSNSDTKGKSATRTITGCLTQGSDANKFVLKGEDGSTWDVKSDTVSLADHVGHEIKATGVVSHNKMHNMKEDTKDMAQDAGADKNNSEHGHMQLTDVHMVSDSCK